MNIWSRGIRNVFRNPIRALSVIIILGLAVGLCLVMLIAHQAVGQKIQQVKSSVGTTISISPAGFSAFSQANNALTTSQLNKISSLPHVTSLDETLTDRLTTIGSSAPSFGFGNNSASSSNNQTSLKSPVTVNVNRTNGNGPSFFISGGGDLPSNFSPPITIIGTNSPSTINGTNLTVSSGSLIDGSTDTSQALISGAMASKNNLKVGSTFTAYSANLTVKGIFSTANRGLEGDVIVSLPTEQRLSGQSGDVTSATATVDSVDNLASTTSAIKNTLGSSADIENSQDQVNNEVQPLKNVQSISLASLIGAVIAGGIIIFLVMLMIVRERRREIGVFKAIGAGNFRVIIQFMTEALTFTLLAAVVGIIIGVAASNSITNTLVTNASNSSTPSVQGSSAGPGSFTRRFAIGGGQSAGPRFVARGRGLGVIRSNITNIHAVVSWSIIFYGLAAAVAIALIGSALSSYLVAKVRPAEVLRSE